MHAAQRESETRLNHSARQRHCTILVVTHDPSILDIADRHLALEDGRMEPIARIASRQTHQLLEGLARASRAPDLAREIAGLDEPALLGFLTESTEDLAECRRVTDTARGHLADFQRIPRFTTGPPPLHGARMIPHPHFALRVPAPPPPPSRAGIPPSLGNSRHTPLHAQRTLPRLAPLLLLLTLGAPPSQASDWSRYRGPDGQGISHGQALPTTWGMDQNLAWKTQLPGPGGSSPVVFGDRIYLTCYTGYAVPGAPTGNLAALQRHVLCLSRVDGKILWNKAIPATQPEQDKVRDHGYASSTPLVDADRVCVFLGKSGVRAFSHEGQELWKADVGSGIHGWGSASSPMFAGDRILVNAAVECGALMALDPKTGKELWRAGGMKESWNTPILVPVAGGRTEVVMAILGKVLGLDPDTGRQLWSCDTGIGWYMVPSLVNDKDVVYCIGGRTGGALAVRAGGRGDVTASHRLWTLNRGSNVSSPILHQGHLYWFHEALGIAYCAEAATGKLVYEERLPRAGQFYASPVLADGKLYAVTREGVTFVLQASPKFNQIARNELRDRGTFDASPAIDGGRLLLRSDKYLYCVGTK